MPRSSAAERAAIESRRVHRVYEILARVYDDCFDWALGPGRREAVSRLPVETGERVLEVGVGTGLSLPHYPRGCHITGIDISEAMLGQARERAEELGRTDVDLRLMDARKLGYPDATFDHVLAPYVVSVVPEPRQVMAEIRRVCKPGGTVLVVNHFRHRSWAVRPLEGLLTPATQWIGFRLDLPLEVVTGTPGLETVRVERVNLLKLWHLLELRRSAEPLEGGGEPQ
jgi:phosphatidylethanolamine/phosphatidyl-N-methylethanolamine N-methyltransferase